MSTLGLSSCFETLTDWLHPDIINKIVRMRNMSLGRSKIDIGSETIEIFDRERTIVDAFRYLGKETAIKALKRGLSMQGSQRTDLKKLKVYAGTEHPHMAQKPQTLSI